jgi:hypothetical protein
MAADATRSELLDLFRRGEVPREVKLLAAQGVIAPRAHEQLSILVLLTDDADAEIAAAAATTLNDLPRAALQAFLARDDVAADVLAYFAARGILPVGAPTEDADSPLIEREEPPDLATLERELAALLGEAPPAADAEDAERKTPISALPIMKRLKLAMRGTRDQRAVLIRDSNKMVSIAVLSSPKVTDSEIESFARMANVSEDVLRVIAANRQWTKNYTVTAALAKNPKTPPSITLPLVGRLNERDLKGLSTDRNVPEGVRIAARKLLLANQSRRTET